MQENPNFTVTTVVSEGKKKYSKEIENHWQGRDEVGRQVNGMLGTMFCAFSSFLPSSLECLVCFSFPLGNEFMVLEASVALLVQGT